MSEMLPIGAMGASAFMHAGMSIKDHCRCAIQMLSDDITSSTRLLLVRRVADRVRRIAPFLQWDRDPYLVLHEGRMVWVIDGYTTSDRYPYSEPLVAFSRTRLNYIRNSVKAMVDAYEKLYWKGVRPLATV